MLKDPYFHHPIFLFISQQHFFITLSLLPGFLLSLAPISLKLLSPPLHQNKFLRVEDWLRAARGLLRSTLWQIKTRLRLRWKNQVVKERVIRPLVTAQGGKFYPDCEKGNNRNVVLRPWHFYIFLLCSCYPHCLAC